MKWSGTIFQSIALIILVVLFILFWNFSKGAPPVESIPELDEINSDSSVVLQKNLYRMLPALFGSLFFSIAAAFYLEERLVETGWIYRIIARQIDILAGIPSLLYGLLGIHFFVFKTGNVPYFTHVLTVVLLLVPITVQSTQKAIKDVDISVKEAAYALGANRWRIIVDHVFPHAFPAILAGIFTAVSRVLAIAALIIAVYEWKQPLQSGNVFTIPSSVIVLLSAVLLSSILSSFLEKRTYYH